MEEIDWNAASNSQLEEECARLEKDFNEQQEKMINIHRNLLTLSEKYNKLTEILDKRHGKK